MAGNDLPSETQNIIPKPNRFLLPASALIVLLIVTAVSIYTWYYHYLPRSCAVTAVEESSTILASQVKRYDDVYQSATAASQTSAVVPLAVMQQILMDTQQVSVPACMQTAKTELINYMGTVIRAFLAYTASEANTVVRDLIDESETHFANFTTEMREVKKCAPFCLPY